MRPLVSVALVLALTTGCVAAEKTPAPAPTATQPLPLLGLDPCPSADQLLPSDAEGDKVLPDLTIECLGDGPDVSLRRLGGRPVVVNLWASWCGPCRKEMPAFQEVYREMKGRVHFLGVNTKDTARAARETAQLTAISYPVLFDPKGELRKALGGVSALAMPTTLVLDQSGVIVEQLVGEQTADELRAALRRAGATP